MSRNTVDHRTERAHEGRGWGARRSVAFMLSAVLAIEALFGNGVNVALAETLVPQDEPAVETLMQGTPEGEEGPEVPEPGQNPTDHDSEDGSLSEEPSTDEGSDAVDSVTDNDETEVETDSVVESQTDPAAGDQADPATGDQIDETPSVEPLDWTGRTDELSLSSPDGLTLDIEALSQAISEAKTKLEAGLESEEQVDSGEDSPSNASTELDQLLPELLPATLSLGFELSPASNDAAVDEGDPAATNDAEKNGVNPGDSFVVELPECVTATDEALSAGGGRRRRLSG